MEVGVPEGPRESFTDRVPPFVHLVCFEPWFLLSIWIDSDFDSVFDHKIRQGERDPFFMLP